MCDRLAESPEATIDAQRSSILQGTKECCKYPTHVYPVTHLRWDKHCKDGHSTVCTLTHTVTRSQVLPDMLTMTSHTMIINALHGSGIATVNRRSLHNRLR